MTLHCGSGEAGVAYQLEEAALELGLGPGRLITQVAERFGERPDPVAAGAARDQRVEREEVQEVLALSGFQGRAELLGTERLGQVEQGPRD
jgi:hypothetical protein